MTTTPPIPPFNIEPLTCGFVPRECRPGELLDTALESATGNGTSPWFWLATAVVVVAAIAVIGWLGVSVRKAVEAHRATELKARDIYLKESAAKLSARRLAATELNAETRARARVAKVTEPTDADLPFTATPPVNLDKD